MRKYIEKSDLDNKELKNLPIRRGCNNVFGCACLGICKNIEGYIDRKDYEDFISNFKSVEDFLDERCNK
jgi:hypothetical protein